MKTIYFVLGFFILSTFLTATIINVPGDQPTIQAGIDVAADTDTVLVQPGTYFENIDYNGKLITVASLFLTTQDTTYISQTIIDGNQDGSVVTFESGEDSTAVLCGFTIINGYGSGYPDFTGGGITCINSSPSIANITISGNFAHIGGGISCFDNSNPSIMNVTISGNTATDGGGIHCYYNSSPSLMNVVISDNSGGGIYCSNSSPSLENVVISDNSATSYYGGGGIYCGSSSNPSIVNVTISGNTATDGGGICCYYNSSPSLVSVTISGNTATDGGGICCYYNSSPSLVSVTISGNTASYNGGGIYCGSNSSLSLQNVIISDNNGCGLGCSYSNPSLVNVIISDNSGGGIYCGSNSSPSLVNVSITGNYGANYGGIYCRNNSNPDLTNCIMWNDSPEEIYFYEDYDPNSITISYSDIQDGEAGIVTNNNGTVNWLEGNIDEDPLFVGTGDHPFMLQDLSPCVNVGIPDTTGMNLPEFDLAGNPRVYGGRIDMGAYENQNVVVDVNEVLIPLVTKLNQNYPNPFNPTTTINYSLKENSKVSLNIYNIKGQKVKTLVNEMLPAGEHSVIWNGRDSNDKRVSSGIYFYKLKAGDFQKVRKMVLVK